MATPTEKDWEVEAIKKYLFKLAMQGKWNDVVATYEKKAKAHRARITRTGDTALHISILDRKESVVEKLVKLINDEVRNVEGNKENEVKGASTSCRREEEGEREEESKHPLEIPNERGNTPLHLAASIGNVRICLCIAREHRELVGLGNEKRETPLFLAALLGKKEAFLLSP